jgi:hypothetical protein
MSSIIVLKWSEVAIRQERAGVSRFINAWRAGVIRVVR